MENFANQNSQQATGTKGGSKKIIFILVAVITLLAIAGLGYYLLSTPKEEMEEASEETSISENETTETPELTPTTMEASKADISVSLLNGTGIAGEAGSLKTEMEKLGFSKIETGNADATSYKETIVTYSTDIPQSVKDEILASLGKIYQTVETKTQSLTSSKIEIIIGLKKGQSAKVTATPTPKTSATVTPTKSGTGTVTPTKTPTPTQ